MTNWPPVEGQEVYVINLYGDIEIIEYKEGMILSQVFSTKEEAKCIMDQREVVAIVSVAITSRDEEIHKIEYPYKWGLVYDADIVYPPRIEFIDEKTGYCGATYKRIDI